MPCILVIIISLLLIIILFLNRLGHSRDQAKVWVCVCVGVGVGCVGVVTVQGGPDRVGSVGMGYHVMVCGVGNWSYGQLNLVYDRFRNLMDWCWGLLGSKATSGNGLELSIKSSLCSSNLLNIIKIGTGNLRSLNISSKSSLGFCNLLSIIEIGISNLGSLNIIVDWG